MKPRPSVMAGAPIKAGDIDVSSSQGAVTLIGRVSTGIITSDAERTARGTNGFKDVSNELLVGNMRSWCPGREVQMHSARDSEAPGVVTPS